MKKYTRLIDRLIGRIKLKGDTYGFNHSDTKIILTLEISRLELSHFERISDLTASALSEISAMTIHQHYRNDYPELHDEALDIINIILNFNSSDTGIIGFTHEKWTNYLNSATRELLNGIQENK